MIFPRAQLVGNVAKFKVLQTALKCLFKKVFEDFQSRWWHRQPWLTPSHNHIKITSKIWNNHHSEQSEIELNMYSHNYKIKETTSIQTRGRCADAEQAGPLRMCGR